MTSSDTPTLGICLQCGRELDDTAVHIEDGSFCRTCYDALRGHLEQAIRQQSEGVPYGNAAIGGILGGAAGAAVWWGFTVTTGISFGLVAVVIGFATGWGVLRFSGGKRSQGLQALSAGIALVAFVYATYLVNRTFVIRAYAEDGQEVNLPFVPDVELLVAVIRATFGLFDLVFLAIALWEAWRRPAPVRFQG